MQVVLPRRSSGPLRFVHDEQVLPRPAHLRLLPQAAQELRAVHAALAPDARRQHPMRRQRRVALPVVLDHRAAAAAAVAAALPRAVRRRPHAGAALRLVPRLALLCGPALVCLLPQDDETLCAVPSLVSHDAARRHLPRHRRVDVPCELVRAAAAPRFAVAAARDRGMRRHAAVGSLRVMLGEP